MGSESCGKPRCCWIAVVSGILVALLLAEGLVIGLLMRRNCDEIISENSTESPVKSTTTPPNKNEQWHQYRLPPNILPLKYSISLRPVLTSDNEGKYWFYGSSTILLICKIPTKYIILHSSQLEYKKQIEVRFADDNSIVELKQSFFVDETMYMVIETMDECVEGSQYILNIPNFVGELADDLRGFYRSQYLDENGRTRIIATSQMSPVSARKAFPCFDEPGFKANFSITLWYKKDSGYFALSNMPYKELLTKQINGEVWEGQVFKDSVPMSTFLIALVVCDFKYVEAFTENNLQTRIYARSEVIANNETDFAIEVSPKVLDFFTEYFNVPYPLPKSDIMAVADFAVSAMENWGLVIYRESRILYRPGETSVFEREYMVNVIAHELTHQWFGNLVSPKFWNDLWLKEGFATYFSYVGENHVKPEWNSFDLFLTEEMHPAMDVDSLTTSHPIVTTVNTVNEIQSQFDHISYNKGACILRMTHDFLGSTFMKALTNYLNELVYQAATHRDLFQKLEKQASEYKIQLPTNLSTIMETWTLQMGYPVVSVFKSGHQYNLTQEYFLMDSETKPVHAEGSYTYNYTWYIPFTYKQASGLDADGRSIAWMSPHETLTISSDDYIVGNIDGKGYYRVNYDPETWAKLAEKLMTSHKDFSRANRAQLIDDAFKLASAKKLDITTAFSITKYLKKELDYIPWKTFNKNIEYIDKMLARSPAYGLFKKYIKNLAVPSIYKSFGWNEKNKTDPFIIQRMTTREAVETTCDNDHEHCIARASELFTKWMKDPKNNSVISSTYRESVYCTAIAHGGEEEWDFAWGILLNSTNAQHQDNLRHGLACSRTPWILNRYLLHTLDPTKIRRQDAIQSIRYIGEREHGRDLAWSFLVANWDTLYENFGSGFAFDRLIRSLTIRFSTEYDLQKLKNFVDSRENLGSAKRAFEQAVERTKINIEWVRENEEKLFKWLQNN